MGTQLRPSPKGQSPQFSAHICCGQMAGWIKMPRGREVDFGPSDILCYMGIYPAPLPQKGAQPPSNFRHISILTKRLDGSRSHLACRYGRPRPRPHCARWGPSFCPQRKRGTAPVNFRPMSVVAQPLNGLRCHLVWR